MKKQYIVPFVEIVNVRLIGSVLETGNMGNDSDETGVIEAKESEFEEEEGLINPTQPNLWDDNEEE
jgi:hypothetical protein